MPSHEQFLAAVQWALMREDMDIRDMNLVVDYTRQYFTEHNIECEPMNYTMLAPYVSELGY